MNKAILLGSLFLRASSVYAGATYGDLIQEGRRRNEEAYERMLDQRDQKAAELSRNQKVNSTRIEEKNLKVSKAKSS